MLAGKFLTRAGLYATAARHRLPEPLNAAVERAKWARHRGTAKTTGRSRRDGLVDPRTGAAARVLIGPANFAGQGLRWAQALGRAGVPAVCWEYVADGRFAFGADFPAPITVNAAPLADQRDTFDAVARTVDAVVIEAGRPLFGALFAFDPVAEAQALAERGVHVALLWHGTDVRLPSQHVRTHPQSPFLDPAHRAQVRALESVARRNRRRLARFDGPVIVSTPDLMDAVPGAVWCPVVVDLERWPPRPAHPWPAIPVVAHVPSNPWLKGTGTILPGLAQLAGEGVIDLAVKSGLTSDEVRSLYTRADVIVDQFGLGIYGVAACEAMALGALLVSGIDSTVQDAVRRETGWEMPSLAASPAEVPDLLRHLALDPEPALAIASGGPEFVRDVHDGRRSAQVLREALSL